MMMKCRFGKVPRPLFWLLGAAAALIISSCATTPTSFVPSSSSMDAGEWSVIELHDDLEYSKAWQEVVDVVARKFDLEMVEKETGYARTSWIYTWWKSGTHTENYRVRAMVKFDPDKNAVSLKTDAHYRDSETGNWITGMDTLLLETLKTDIMGTVGRTTR